MSNPEGNVKRIMCFANVYCKQTKVGSITHYSLHIPLSVGWKTLRCFVFQREKKNYFPGWNGGIFSFEIWTVNCYGLLKKKMPRPPWDLQKDDNTWGTWRIHWTSYINIVCPFPPPPPVPVLSQHFICDSGHFETWICIWYVSLHD